MPNQKDQDVETRWKIVNFENDLTENVISMG